MRSVYRSGEAQRRVQAWCLQRLGQWSVPHERWQPNVGAGVTHVVAAGASGSGVTVVFVPGTNFSAATCLPLVTALAARGTTLALDLPGQPGLSDGRRPRTGRIGWYAQWLSEVLDAVAPGRVIVVGHSLGGAIALACDSPRIAGRVLISPGGLVRLQVPARVLRATVPWMLWPSDPRSAALLRLMLAPGNEPPSELVEWMTLVAGGCRSSLAPNPLSPAVLTRCTGSPLVVAAGVHDVFLPPQRLEPTVTEHLGVTVTALPHVGHLAPDEEPGKIVALVDDVFRTAPSRRSRRPGR